MRAWPLLLVCLAALGGCEAFGTAVGVLVGVDATITVPVFGRAAGDLAYSVISGRDCSVVRLEQGRTYCRPREGPPEPPPFCTRSLGVAECWAHPAALPGHPMPLADAPASTAEQEARRVARWPDL